MSDSSAAAGKVPKHLSLVRVREHACVLGGVLNHRKDARLPARFCAGDCRSCGRQWLRLMLV